MNGSVLPKPQVVILAAGFSSRLGRPKALVRIRGLSLLRRTVRLLAPFSARRPLVVIPNRAPRHRSEVPPHEARCVVNPQRLRGLSSSVILGLRRAGYSAAVLLVPVDLERLSRRDVAALVSRWRAARRRVAARRVGPHGGTPLILPRWLYPAALGVTGDQGLRSLLAALPPDLISLLDLHSAAFDVDTPEDLAAARRHPRSPQGAQG